LAYGNKYEIKFKNRITKDFYRVEIWQKDYVGSVLFQLAGADTPFVAAYDDQDLLSPIHALSLTISFVNGVLTIEDFYSDDDEAFRIDFYFESDSTGGGTEALLFSGYLIQDGASEPVTDRQHYITLKATDNLGLLKNVHWDEAVTDPFGSFPIGYYLRYCLKQTGLYSHDTTIDKSLPLRIFDNLFENTTDDRGDDPEADPWAQTVVHSGIFQGTDNTYDDCYALLEKILISRNACLVQAEGCWNIIRKPEYKLFTDGEIEGVQYVYNGSGTDIDAVTLETAFTIDRGGDFYPVEEDQLKTILRPLKYVKNTFNYNQPGSYIIQDTLQLPDGATPYDTDTIGDFRYDKYSLATYFPDWIQRGGDGSYLEVVTDIASDPENETDRYIVTPGVDDQQSGVQFNPIPVSRGDVFEFTLQFRTDTDTDDNLRFYVRFEIILADGTFVLLTRFPGTGSSVNVHWTGPFSTDTWDVGLGVDKELGDESEIDTTEWIGYSLNEFVEEGGKLPLIPADGMLLIQVNATNGADADNRQTTYWKDISLDVTNYINQSTKIVGHTHTDTGTSTIKAIQENEIPMDDSPRNTIAGTLFTDAVTAFDFVDISTGENTDIGSIFFTKTTLWHRAAISEALRLGNIVTLERLEMQYKSRLQVEGSFRPLRLSDSHLSILKLFRIGWLTGSNFLFSGLTIDYMNCKFNGRLITVSIDEEDITEEYEFKYLYEKST
jgi:hypothetical protein